MPDANTGLRCKEMLFLEFSDIDWSVGVLHIRNKKAAGFQPKGRRERRIPLNAPAIYALRAMLQKKHPASDYIFYQADGSPWKVDPGVVRSLLKRANPNDPAFTCYVIRSGHSSRRRAWTWR